MGTVDVVVLLGALCGLVMVVGGFVLFYKGIVTLQQASAKDAITLELRNILKIQSRYPAYGFFIFGLAFLALSAVYAKPDDLPPITVSGAVENAVDPSATRITMELPLTETTLASDGQFKRVLRPELDRVRIGIVAPGNDPASWVVEVDTARRGRERVASFPPVKLKKVGMVPRAGLIEELPKGASLPPPEDATGLREAP